ncbi:hypothetical protein [Streptomyces sp. NPDC001642]|uniref:hypothetical protein n=1 Tax=Streptomyces sp. NPDC001642 TaxID=3154392 RepID=UPI003330EEAF
MRDSKHTDDLALFFGTRVFAALLTDAINRSVRPSADDPPMTKGPPQDGRPLRLRHLLPDLTDDHWDRIDATVTALDLRAMTRGQAGVMFSACGPFWPWVMSKVTF